jgi:hypothetical protein
VPKKGTCDIFFPTHFRTLEQLYHTVGAHVKPNTQTTNISKQPDQSTSETRQTSEMRKRTTQILRNRNFMKLYANLEQTTTASGFNPLLEDYANMHFFVAE